jgi:hypothetical protein
LIDGFVAGLGAIAKKAIVAARGCARLAASADAGLDAITIEVICAVGIGFTFAAV